MLTTLPSLVRMVFRRDAFERDMSEEMRFHLDAYAEDLIREGMAPDQARRRASLEFGARGALEEDCREARGIRVLEELRQDLRYAGRQLVRTPGFALTAAFSLALGIGANSAIFGLMDAILFRTLPLANASQLYLLGHGAGDDFTTASNYPLLERYRQSGIFASVTSSSRLTFTVASAEGLERVDGQYVSGNYHATLGVRLALGRGFTDEPDRPAGRAPVAVISDGYWTRRFGRRSDVVGQTLSIGDRTVTIVGVTAPGFHGLTPGFRADITLPVSLRASGDPAFFDDRDRWISLLLVARRRPDLSMAQTRAAASDLFQRYWAEPESGRPAGQVRPGVLVPAGRGTDELRERYGLPLQLLLGMVGIVLLIACANVANLSFARGTSRAREVAVRLSLGAGRGRLVRQMLTESALLAMLGGAVGLLIATVSTRLIASAFATGERPLFVDASLNWRMVAFTAAISMLTVFLVGLAPALRSSRVDITPALKHGAIARRLGRWPVGRVLVAAQLALSVVVVAVAALLARTVLNLRSVDAGFARGGTVLFNVEASGIPTPEQRVAFFETLESRLRSSPGVEAVAYAQRSPLDRSVQIRPIEIPGLTDENSPRGVSANVVTPDFFRVFGIEVLRGRGLSAGDRAGAEPVAVVDEALVSAYFGSADPLGRRVILGADREPYTIVGVVRSARFENLREEPFRTIYTPLAQSPLGSREVLGDIRRITVVLRTRSDPRPLAAAVPREVSALSNRVIASYVRTMDQQLDAALLRERLLARLSGAYGLLALLLSLVGLYGVASYGVAQRTRDIGVRMALGARRERVLSAVLGETLATSLVGLAIGLAGAVAATELVAAFLFGVAPRDPPTLSGVAVLIAATSLVAGYGPARRAASVDPVRALASN